MGKRVKVVEDKSKWTAEQWSKEWRMRNGHRQPIPEPTYRFKVGDKVDIGNLEDEIIEHVLEDGKLYVVRYTATDHNYGNPIRHTDQLGAWAWYNIDRPREERSKVKLHKPMPQMQKLNQPIGSFLGQVMNYGVDMDPPYQRGHVWSLEDKQKLIQSIFEDRQIGLIVMRRLPFGKAFHDEVVDGKQRLQALIDYRLSRFEFAGLKFCDLSNGDQHVFDNTTVQTATLDERATDEQVLETFVRLNRGGKPMDNAVLERAEHMLAEMKGEKESNTNG